MTWGDREELLNLPNLNINRDDLNPATVLRRILPGSGILLAGTGVGDETISVSSGYVVPVTRSVIAGTGLVGGGQLTGDVTLHAGAGDGIQLAADSIAVDSSVVRTSRAINTGTGLAGGGNLTADRTLVVASPVVLVNRAVNTGTGLAGGGDLTADRMLAVASPVVWLSDPPAELEAPLYSASDKAWYGGAVVLPSRAIITGTGLSGGGDLFADRTLVVASPVVLAARAVNTGTGLAGGGNLTADRTLAVASPVVLVNRAVNTGTGLAGGGNLTADRVLSVASPVVIQSAAAATDQALVWEGGKWIPRGFLGTRVRLASTRAIPPNTAAPLAFDTEMFDTDNWYLAASPAVITVTRKGYYMFAGTVVWTGGWTASRIFAYIEGSGVDLCHSEFALSHASAYAGHTLATIVASAASVMFCVRVFQNSAATRTIYAGTSHFEATYLGP